MGLDGVSVGPVPLLVLHVLLVSAPPEIGERVVRRGSVHVSPLDAFGRRAGECSQGQAMHQCGTLATFAVQRDSQMAAGLSERGQNSFGHFWARPPDALEGANSPKIRHFIAALVADYGQPSLVAHTAISMSAKWSTRSVASSPRVAAWYRSTISPAVCSNCSAAAWMASNQRGSGRTSFR